MPFRALSAHSSLSRHSFLLARWSWHRVTKGEAGGGVAGGRRSDESMAAAMFGGADVLLIIRGHDGGGRLVHRWGQMMAVFLNGAKGCCAMGAAANGRSVMGNWCPRAPVEGSWAQ